MFSLHVLKEPVRLIGCASLLDDIECPILLVEEGGALATNGVGGEMTSCLLPDPGLPLLEPMPFKLELGK